MKISIIGLAQAGKKTLFSLLTGVEISEYRKSGEALKGLAKLHDKRVQNLSKMFEPKKTTYAETEFLLCPDIELNSGKYSWLLEARTSDLMCIVVRDFASNDVFHPQGEIDSKRDRVNIESELILADLELIEKRLERIKKDKKKMKQTPKQLTEEATIKKFKDSLEQEIFLNTIPLTNDEYASVVSLNFVTLKKFLFCYNISEDEIEKKYRESKDSQFFISAQIENEIIQIEDPSERNEYMNELGFNESGINRLNSTAYDLLGLMSFYTTGKDEVRAWTIFKGSLAPIAGGKIHSDIERGFIRVEIIKYDDLMNTGNEQLAKSAGKAQTKGKDYVIEDGDTCHFLFNV